jgi:hypothetical protein
MAAFRSLEWMRADAGRNDVDSAGNARFWGVAQAGNCTTFRARGVPGNHTQHEIDRMNNLDRTRAQPRDTKIRLHGPDAFEGMMKAGQLAAMALDLLVPHVKPGVTTEHLDDLVVEFAQAHGAIPRPSTTAAFPNRSARP